MQLIVKTYSIVANKPRRRDSHRDTRWAHWVAPSVHTPSAWIVLTMAQERYLKAGRPS